MGVNALTVLTANPNTSDGVPTQRMQITLKGNDKMPNDGEQYPNSAFEKAMNTSVNQKKDEIDILLDEVEVLFETVDILPEVVEGGVVYAQMRFKPSVTKAQVEEILSRMGKILTWYDIRIVTPED